MKKSLLLFITIIVLSAFVQKENSNKKTFKQLYKLEGTWKMKIKNGAVYEGWKMMDKNYLQSRGYFIKATDTIINERVALQNKADGIYYTSTVEEQNNKQPVAFKMSAAKNNMFVFENAEHDFPKRIAYEFITSDSLHAWIDDGIDGSKYRQNFYYSRIK